MSANRKQLREAAPFAAHSTARRRSLPTRLMAPVPMSQYQRWRERPRRRALRLTPGCPDGSFTPSLVVSRVAVCEPSCAGEPRRPRAHSRGQKRADVFRRNRFAHERRSPEEHDHDLDFDSNCTPIAPMMLVPCSASSMLSASLRPGPWPGLRALTTPARGTHWQLRDGGHLMTVHNDLDANITRAYGGLITSVPHGTPPVSPQRHPERAFRRPPQRHGLEPSLTTSQPVAGSPTAVGLHTVGCEHHGFSRRRVLSITHRNEPAFTWA